MSFLALELVIPRLLLLEEAHAAAVLVVVEDTDCHPTMVEDGPTTVEDTDGHPAMVEDGHTIVVAVLQAMVVLTCHDLCAQRTPSALSTRITTASQEYRMRNSMRKLITILLLMKKMKTPMPWPQRSKTSTSWFERMMWR